MAKFSSVKKQMEEELVDLKEMEMDDEMDLFDDLDETEDLDDFDLDDNVIEDFVEDKPTTKVNFSSKLPNKQRKVQKAPTADIELDSKPVKKSTKPVAKEVITMKVDKKESTPKKETVAKSKQSTGKTRTRTTVSGNASYDALFGKVTEKVERYNTIMEAREKGKTKEIPQSVVISKDLLNSLLTAKFTEENDAGLKAAMQKAMVSMGFDKDDVKDAVTNYTFKKVETELIYNTILNVFYDVLNAEAGISLFKTDDCNCSLKGQWTDPKVSANEHLKTNKASYIDSFLRVSASSPAPLTKKATGTIKGGKFIPDPTDEE